MDRGGGGQVVSALTLYSNGLSSNPGEVYSFFSKLFEKDENIRKEAHFKKYWAKTSMLLLYWMSSIQYEIATSEVNLLHSHSTNLPNNFTIHILIRSYYFQFTIIYIEHFLLLIECSLPKEIKTFRRKLHQLSIEKLRHLLMKRVAV